MNLLFDWDPSKSEKNLRERGFNFAFAGLIFEGEVEEFIDDRSDYGEVRVIAFGSIGEDQYAVVYTTREDVRWIISAFRTRQKELNRWRRRAAGR